jgi:transketolase N-terminal domain/subunit
MNNPSLEQLAINTIRTLSMDAVEAARSGHPGTPMALAPLVYTLWNQVLNFDPADPVWPNRDRFVLSNGHASMLLWSVLHLSRVQAVNADYESLGKPSVSLDDIRRFRQLDSKAPGHPEYHLVSGVEATTGPLGQGVATSVGMAIARKWLAHQFNRPNFELFNYNIYAVCGDGCMMEGISAGSSTTTTSPSRVTRASLSPKTLPRAFWPMVGMCCGWETPMTQTASNTRWKYSGGPKAGPPFSFWTAISVMVRPINRTPPKPTANRWATRKSG